jgi:molybdopterin molybdotransferase
MSPESVNPDPSCEDDYDPNSMPVHVARAAIHASVTPVVAREHVAVRESLGRVLAQTISAPFDVPPHRNSARDGYALRSADVVDGSETVVRVVGASFAGHPFQGTLQPGEATRVMTGAAMPDGADAVAMQEHVRVDGDNIVIAEGAARSSHIRHPGEDLKAGTEVMAPGRRLHPADLGVIASLGCAEVTVYRKPRVAFFSTGDELRSVGETLGHGDIYDSNRYTVFGMLERLGVEIVDMGVVRDSEESVRAAFEEASACADVVVSTGGVSVGDADYVTGMLAELGTVNFWKIAMKPGRPLTFGRVHDALFFGLPGNPVSVMVTFYQFVQPALRALMGCTHIDPPTVRVPLACAITDKQPGRLEYQRGILATDAGGNLAVSTTGAQGSHVLNSMSNANCFMVLPLDCAGLEAGELVDVQPFEGLF